MRREWLLPSPRPNVRPSDISVMRFGSLVVAVSGGRFFAVAALGHDSNLIEYARGNRDV